MTKNLKTLLLLPALYAGIALSAQDKKELTLDSAISMSLQHSGQMRLSKARIEEADALLKQAEQRKLPDASVSGSYVHLSSANVDLKTQNSSGGSSAPPKISQAMYGILNASLPIYAGGRINYGIEAAQLLEKAARLDAENDKAEVIQTTVEAFINLYKTRQVVSLVQANLSQTQQRVKDLSNLEQNGLIARNDLLRAQLQSSNTELALLDAENNKTLSNTAVVLLLGLPDQTEVIPDSTVFNTSIEMKSLDEFLQNARNARNDRAALDLKKKAAETGIRSAKGEYYPNLSLTGGYIAANIPKFVTITNAVNIGIGVNYNIASLWKTKAKIRQAQAKADQLKFAEGMLDDKIKTEVNQAYLAWLSSRKKTDVYAFAVDQATENYRITKNKFDNTLASVQDLLDADVLLLQTKLNDAMSKADVLLTWHRLLKSAGAAEKLTK